MDSLTQWFWSVVADQWLHKDMWPEMTREALKPMNYSERQEWVKENDSLVSAICITLGGPGLMRLRGQHKWQEAV